MEKLVICRVTIHEIESDKRKQTLAQVDILFYTALVSNK